MHPEKMPATPSPATALRIPVSARSYEAARGNGQQEKPDGTHRPPTRTALVGATAQIREPSSKRKIAAKNPHFAYADLSESVRSGGTALASTTWRRDAKYAERGDHLHQSSCRCARTTAEVLGYFQECQRGLQRVLLWGYRWGCRLTSTCQEVCTAIPAHVLQERTCQKSLSKGN